MKCCISKYINQLEVPHHLRQAGFSPSVLGQTQKMILGSFLLSTGELKGTSEQYLRQERIFHPKTKQKNIIDT